MPHFNDCFQEADTLPYWLTQGLAECTAAFLDRAGLDSPGVVTFFRQFGDLFEAATQLPPVNRLLGLRQLGIKVDPRAIQAVNRRQVATAPFPHTRFDHSKMVAALNIAIGLRLGLNQWETACLGLGGLFHDLGHLAFGHDAEALTGQLGEPDHETRSQRIVTSNPKLVMLLHEFGLQPHEVTKVVGEVGRLGTIESLSDSLAFVILDSEMAGDSSCNNLASQILQSLLGQQNDGRFLVSTTDPFSAVLRRRARLFQTIYETKGARLAKAALQLTLRHALRTGLIQPTVLTDGTDAEIEMIFAHVFNHPRDRQHIPQWIHDSWDMAHGFFGRLNRWDCRSFPDEETMVRWLFLQPASRLPSTIVVPAIKDFTGKTIPVEQNGSPSNLRAPAEMFTKEHRTWFAAVYSARR